MSEWVFKGKFANCAIAISKRSHTHNWKKKRTESNERYTRLYAGLYGIWADTNRASSNWWWCTSASIHTSVLGVCYMRSAKFILLLLLLLLSFQDDEGRGNREEKAQQKSNRINAICILCKHLFVPICISFVLQQRFSACVCECIGIYGGHRLYPSDDLFASECGSVLANRLLCVYTVVPTCVKCLLLWRLLHDSQLAIFTGTIRLLPRHNSCNIYRFAFECNICTLFLLLSISQRVICRVQANECICRCAWSFTYKPKCTHTIEMGRGGETERNE